MEKILDWLFLFFTRVYLMKGSRRTVAISGSIGKTSVTQAIATVLGEEYNVLATKQNYNTHRGVAMTVFDQTIPANRFGWILLAMDAFLKAVFTWPKFDVLVLELGSDRPGDLNKFSFLKPDIAVVTATTAEHMGNFKTLQAVAKEELSIVTFSSQIIINTDLVPTGYIEEYCTGKSVVTYGKGTLNTVRVNKNEVIISIDRSRINSRDFNLIGSSGQSTLLAAALVAKRLGMDGMAIKQGLLRIRPAPGRMSKLVGLHGSVIIDDTYNSSPEAIHTALNYLREQKATKKIVLLGMMNEMGDQSENLHRQVGKWCVPKDIDLLVTLGEHANHYLAEEAEKNGCKVVRTSSPGEAGKLIARLLSMGVVVLAKGSQNGVFAEEAVKLLLADQDDVGKLVRQKGYWRAKKADMFVNI